VATVKAARAAPPVARHAKSAPPDQGILIGPGVLMFLGSAALLTSFVILAG